MRGSPWSPIRPPMATSRRRLPAAGIAAAAGPEAVREAAERPVDLVVAAIVGAAGLAPTYAAIRAGHRVALANKECLVSAGRALHARRSGGRRHHPADRFRAQRHLPGARRAADRRGRADHPHRLGRAVPHWSARAHGDGHGGRRAQAPELVDGAQDHHRFGDADEQGSRGDRGPPPVRRRRRKSSTSWSTRSRSSTGWSPSTTAR